MLLQVMTSRTLLVLRLILVTFCVVITIVSGVQSSDPRWFIYLTNWSFLLLTLAMIGLAIISAIHAFGKRQMSGTKIAAYGSQEMGSRAERPDNLSTTQSQNNAIEPKLMSWYEKGKIRQIFVHSKTLDL